MGRMEDRLNAVMGTMNELGRQDPEVMKHFGGFVQASLKDGNLDRKTSEAILQLLLEVNKDYSTARVIVTHSSHVAEMTDKSIYLKEGRLSTQ